MGGVESGNDIYIQLLPALHVDQREADCLSNDYDWASWDLLCLWA